MQKYELGGWILVAAAAVFGCGGSTDTALAGKGKTGGGLCTANNECASGLCLAGACASGNPGGGTCKSDAECASGVCQGSVCVGNGQGVPSGAACTSSDQCASGTCTSSVCASGSSLPDGKSCTSVAECASGACTKYVCGTGIDIKSGTGGASSGGGANATGGAANATGGGANATGGAANATGGAGPIVDGGPTVFGTTECTDGLDNDKDGLIDSMDPECTGPLDNDESTFATGIPGDNVDPKWQDCFFDGNSGAGDDGCRYATGCLTGTVPQTDPNCQTTAQCQKFCKTYAPNGCDCFGCCAVSLPGGGTKNVFIKNTCTLADINDPTKCPTCTQSADCVNTCEKCELCVGKDTLPAECVPPPGTGGTGNGGAAGAAGAVNAGGASNGGVPNAGGAGGAVGSGGSSGSCAKPICPSTRQACGVSCLPACPTGEYCLTGCCIVAPR